MCGRVVKQCVCVCVCVGLRVPVVEHARHGHALLLAAGERGAPVPVRAQAAVPRGARVETHEAQDVRGARLRLGVVCAGARRVRHLVDQRPAGHVRPAPDHMQYHL